MEGSLCFKIDCLIVGSKFTVFALFYFVFALPVWGAYIWRGLFSEFYGYTILTLTLWDHVICTTFVHL